MLQILHRFPALLDRAPEWVIADVRLHQLNKRFLWFILCRFFVIAAFLFLYVTKPFIFPHLSMTKPTFLMLAAFLLIVNVAYWLHYARVMRITDLGATLKQLLCNVHAQIIIDMIVLGYLLYHSGGIESPLVYFFLFHNVISCIFFSGWISFFHTTLSLCIIFFITLVPTLTPITKHHFIFPREASALFDNAAAYSYHLAGIATVYFVVWFIAANITRDLKRHEQVLQHKIDELVEMDAEKTRYMLVTTHELKAPFAAIQSYVNIVLGEYVGEITEAMRKVMVKIKARCEILTHRITEMLQLVNITSLQDRRGEVVMEKIEVAALLRHAIDRLENIASEKGMRIALTEGGPYELHASKQQLETIFNNVLLNSINYGYPNTEIIIKAIDTDNKLLITVGDKGIGIKKEHLDKIFLEYFRSERAAAMNAESSGLGLAIARGIMKIHGGRIWAESEEDIGTTVFMEFPKEGYDVKKSIYRR